MIKLQSKSILLFQIYHLSNFGFLLWPAYIFHLYHIWWQILQLTFPRPSIIELLKSYIQIFLNYSLLSIVFWLYARRDAGVKQKITVFFILLLSHFSFRIFKPFNGNIAYVRVLDINAFRLVNIAAKMRVKERVQRVRM